MSVQRYIHTAHGEMKPVTEELPAFDGGWVKNQDHERELAAKDAEIERLTDLVRYARSYLYDQDLISNEEYAALVADSDNGQRVARLEGYDKLRAKVERLSAPVSDEELNRHSFQQYGSDAWVINGAALSAIIASRAEK